MGREGRVDLRDEKGVGSQQAPGTWFGIRNCCWIKVLEVDARTSPPRTPPPLMKGDRFPHVTSPIPGPKSPGRQAGLQADTHSSTASSLRAREARADTGSRVLATLRRTPNSGDPKLSRAMSTNKRGGKATRIRAVPPASAHLRVQGRRGKKRRFRQGYIRGTEPPPPGRELRKAP